MASTRLNFTKAALSKAPPAPKGGKDYYYDEREKGLVLAVTPTGTKTFYLYKRIDGKPERLLLGRFPDISIENARKLATAAKGEIATGANPQKEKRAIRDEMTFGALFNEYLEKYSKVHKRSWSYDEREVNKFLSSWFKRKISSFVLTLNVTSDAISAKPQFKVETVAMPDVSALFRCKMGR